ncbi:MAG: 23S rRNA (pseudouridine(1915)-N(3))-methyltransferase RlmH, partial [Chitinivibrionales bacterium]|nr:23S rRNA (pseudouridine(1915)-N(3))-methyltransferase RlmH [Chitinivibrionales bacterium]
YDSRGFAAWLDKRRRERMPTVFMIGGAYGLDPALVAESNEALSLSTLTFSHDIALVVLLEQIYRAFTILYGHPYHK